MGLSARCARFAHGCCLVGVGSEIDRLAGSRVPARIRIQSEPPKATPELREGYFTIGEATIHFLPFHFQDLARADHLALLRYPDPKATPEGP